MWYGSSHTGHTGPHLSDSSPHSHASCCLPPCVPHTLPPPTRHAPSLPLPPPAQALGGLSSDRIMAIELLWTPHDGEGVLTKGEMLQDYPNLHALH